MLADASEYSYALVYAGPGASTSFIDFTVSMLEQHLASTYIVKRVYADDLVDSSWIPNTSLFVLPGGRDLPYVKDLIGLPNENLIEFVNGGGKFIGFCAGSYYASGRCEFEVGDTNLEIIGNRPLKFFPGTCRGATFKGFDYTSEAGARAAYVTLSHSGDMLPIYYNGGGAFVDAEKYPEVEILATYNGLNNTTPNAAAVLCKVGKGDALLSAVHPEYIPSGLYPQLDVPLILNRNKIYLTLKTWLQKLGLEHSGNIMLMELNPTVTSRNTPEVFITV